MDCGKRSNPSGRRGRWVRVSLFIGLLSTALLEEYLSTRNKEAVRIAEIPTYARLVMLRDFSVEIRTCMMCKG